MGKAAGEHTTFPLVPYMHGSTGQWEFYSENLMHVASHGFIIVFPFIKSPDGDKHWWTTNTDGEYLLKSIEFAEAMSTDASSPLNGLVDMSNIVTAGHSMGATCSIMAATRIANGELPGKSLKLAVAQHPGICGPIGPPPYPATWMKSDLATLANASPFLMT